MTRNATWSEQTRKRNIIRQLWPISSKLLIAFILQTSKDFVLISQGILGVNIGRSCSVATYCYFGNGIVLHVGNYFRSMREMTEKRLSKLKANELEPSEHSLTDEEFSLTGVLSFTSEECMDDFCGNENERMGSVSSTSSKTNGESDKEEDCGDSYEGISTTSLLPTSISRGESVSIMREKTAEVNFAIVDTRIAGRRKHVLYTLVVTRTGSVDGDRAIIERRYSEFLKLYQKLKRKFPVLMKDIKFPEKKFSGNLKESLISDRKRLLADFIQSVYESKEIRTCATFKKFFYLESLQQGCQHICGGMFEVALNYLLNGLHLQLKLALDSTNEIVATMCGVVECYSSLKSFDEVVKYGKAALELIDDDASNVYLVPLLRTLQTSYNCLGEDSSEEERRLKTIVDMNQIEVDHLPSLRELAVKRFTK